MRRALLLLSTFWLMACDDAKPDSKGELIVYAAVDRSSALPLIRAYQRARGIRIRPVFDNEAAKTAGLARRVLLERKAPRADVWWSGEALFTERLDQAECFEALPSRMPAKGRSDPYHGNSWVGFGVRLRVLVYRKDRWPHPETAPRRIADLARPELRGRVILARPLYGTSATHAAWLLSQPRGREQIKAIAANRPLLVAGNAQVVEAIHRGQALLGLCDSDDALIGQERDPRLRFAIPDQEPGGLGVVATPASAAVILGAPHAVEARRFVAWLASPEAETLLAATPSRNLPTHDEAAGPSELPPLKALHLAPLNLRVLASQTREHRSALKRLFPW